MWHTLPDGKTRVRKAAPRLQPGDVLNDLHAELLRERFEPRPSPTPQPNTEADTPTAILRRQLTLVEMPADEWPGEEAA